MGERFVKKIITGLLTISPLKFPSLRLSPHDRTWLKSLIESNVKSGILYRGLQKKRTRAGLHVVRFIVEQWLLSCLRDDSAPVSKYILAALSVVLISATGARAGDIVVAESYTDEYCMKWKDLDLRLEGGTSLAHLRLTVTLRYTKGYKYASFAVSVSVPSG